MSVIERRDSRVALRPVQTAPLMVFVKGMAGCAVLVLCLAGAAAAVTQLPFSAPAQVLATVVGAVGGAILVWHTRLSAAEK
jgi:hypothetical protein